MREVHKQLKIELVDLEALQEIDTWFRVPFVTEQDKYEQNNDGLFMIEENSNEVIIFKDKAEYKLSLIDNQIKFIKK